MIYDIHIGRKYAGIGLIFIFSLLFISGCVLLRPPSEQPEPPVPAIEREFRGVWIATVANIDWPSAPGLSVARQKAELRAIFDRVKDMHMNAVVLQVRPMTDALYPSKYEPWSEYLTGEMGKAPDPFYDPLDFAVEEAHRRGLELHAWFNPFRSRHSSAFSEISDDHVSKKNPDIVHEYGTHLWLDPGMQEAQDHSINVILDVVSRYDIDGVHLDDYFYPYKEQDENGNIIEFPDSLSYALAVETGITLDIHDWRRNNVDRFIERLYGEIKETKPHVRFGISPFGIWRPGYPAQIQGFDAYQEIYADALKWFVNGWCDYFSPQLYWRIDQYEQSYPVLLQWWHEHNDMHRHLWPGNFTSRVTGIETGWPAEEIINQISHTREQEGAEGNIHFSMRVFMRNPGSLLQQIFLESYAKPVLVPASPWLGNAFLSQPEANLEKIGDRYIVSFTPAPGDEVWQWAVRYLHGTTWSIRILPGWQQSIVTEAADGNGRFRVAVISAIDRLGNEGNTAFVRPLAE
jgi:uncharacterized lipoprotein YddW (UPF0748 family)